MRFILIVIALALISCERITEGVIVEKNFEPAHSSLYYTHQQVGKVSVSTPHWRHIPENWTLTFRGKLDGKTKYRTVDVDPEYYYRCNIGQHFKIKPN